MSLKQKIEDAFENDFALSDLVYGDTPDDLEGLEVVEDKIVDTTRWCILKRAVFKLGDEYVAADYDEGATEYQESSGDVTLYEVVPKEVTTVKYIVKK